MDQQTENPRNLTEISDAKLTRNQKKKERKKNKKKGIQKLEIPSDLAEFTMSVQVPAIDDEDDEDYKLIQEKFLKRFIKENDNQEEKQEVEETETPVEISVSKQQVKKYGRPTIGMLKSISRRPELIEPFDTDAPDPFMLAEIKNMRNCVPIPTHWCQKRKYLNYKKGSEVSRYRLPVYLEKTGIPQMRQAIMDFEEKRSLSQKQRERARPKTGLLDVSVTVLRDAFFAQQTKPYLSRFGDLYYEGREAMPNQKNIRPGKISKKLREALGLTSDDQPVPWLQKMQKVGPPPSYPNLKIPGLNAPLPKGAQWGYHPGGWGKVPLENGVPVWGGNPLADPISDDEEESTELWGTLKRSKDIGDGVNI